VGVIRWFATALLVTAVLIVWFALSLTVQGAGPAHGRATPKSLGFSHPYTKNIGVFDGPVHEGSTQPQSQISEHFFQLKREESVSFSSVQFYHLISPSGIAVLSVDGDVPLAQTLRGLEGQRVKLTLENATLVLQKVER
jgi:hypothetical protein